MKKLFLTVLPLLSIFFSVALTTPAQQPRTAKKIEPAVAPAATSALLYKITGKDLKKPSYLFGTIHLACPTDMFPAEKFNPYFDQTDQLVMEIDMDDATEMQSMGKGIVIADGKTIKDFLTAEQFAKVDELFKNYIGTSAENVKQIKPTFLSIMISTSPKALGCTPGSYEMSFLKTAAEKKKNVAGLETVASQFAVFEKIPLDAQAKSLYEMALDPQKSIEQFKKLIAAYKAQDAESLYSFMDEQMQSEKSFQGVLLDDRNKNWIPKIEKIIGEKSSFIAVGGGHLGGKNGVVNLLKAKGYKLEAIKL